MPPRKKLRGDEDRWRLTLSLEFPTVFAQDGQIVLFVSAEDTTFNQIATNAAEKLSREVADLLILHVRAEERTVVDPSFKLKRFMSSPDDGHLSLLSYSEGPADDDDAPDDRDINEPNSPVEVNHKRKKKRTINQYLTSQNRYNASPEREENTSSDDDGFVVDDDQVEEVSSPEVEEEKREKKDLQLDTEDLELIGVGEDKIGLDDQLDLAEGYSSDSSGENSLPLSLLMNKADPVEEYAPVRKAIHQACSEGDIDGVLEVLRGNSQEQRRQIVDEAENDGVTPLMIAAQNGHKNIIQLLLNNGADLDLVDEEGSTVLHYSATGNVHTYRTVREKMNNTKEKNDQGDLPVHSAAAAGACDVLRDILEHRTHLLDVRNYRGYTLMHHAAEGGSSEAVRFLLERGMSPGVRSHDGETPLHICSANGSIDCARVLIESGADVLEKDRGGWPPLFYASFHRHWDLVVTVVKMRPNQLELLGNLMVLRTIATDPVCFSLLNESVRKNPNLLLSNLSFLLEEGRLLDFENKRRWLAELLSRSHVTSHDVLLFHRKNLFIQFTRHYERGDLKVSQLPWLAFEGEEGRGPGVRREFFSCLTSELVSNECNLFRLCRRTGAYEPLAFHFSRAFLRVFLDLSVDIEDLEEIEPEMYKSLHWALSNDVTDLDMFFSVDVREIESIDLVKGGRRKNVTESNKQSYVKEMVRFKLMTSSKRQMRYFKEGFRECVDIDKLKIFNENELDLMLSGVQCIEWTNWRENTFYRGYTASDDVIRWFWETVEEMSQDERVLLLRFSTGCGSVPAGGFVNLVGAQGPQKFTVSKVKHDGGESRLPSASTCFNLLKLPEYKTAEEVKKNVLIAVRYGSEGFGFPNTAVEVTEHTLDTRSRMLTIDNDQEPCLARVAVQPGLTTVERPLYKSSKNNLIKSIWPYDLFGPHWDPFERQSPHCPTDGDEIFNGTIIRAQHLQQDPHLHERRQEHRQPMEDVRLVSPSGGKPNVLASTAQMIHEQRQVDIVSRVNPFRVSTMKAGECLTRL
ncbi:hypothetical protein PROFUN_07007 [Planoprotostelium fungivorum]|uniref:E3 ubiquitin-protein ligase HACE1 n=1 Tax=Planoprotostelium fungivorum TaxID=1890364 RepID=A0A2P6NMQ1_9EUKA|nr:hypothetical protein PROFUN_07007 [Planoprotostelium fungivorum]